jgi:hypothetical protein
MPRNSLRKLLPTFQFSELNLIVSNSKARHSKGGILRSVHASLVANNLAEAIAFPADGNLIPASELLYKKALVLAPSTFNVIDPLQNQMIEATLASLPKAVIEQSKGSIGFFCLSCAADGLGQSTFTKVQMLEHIDALQKLGNGVFFVRERELYKMAAFVNRFTRARIHFACGALRVDSSVAGQLQ